MEKFLGHYIIHIKRKKVLADALSNCGEQFAKLLQFTSDLFSTGMGRSLDMPFLYFGIQSRRKTNCFCLTRSVLAFVKVN